MIKIICVGKIKEDFFKKAITEYEKRMQKYTKLEIIEVKDESNGDILEKEKLSIQKYIDEKDYVIVMDINGKELTSLDLSKKISDIQMINPNITFIIGGSYGLSEDIKKRSNEKISFSKLTFPHQMFRVMLLEQLYRSFKIINNETYHK